MVKKLIDFDTPSTYVAGSGTQIVLPSQSLSLPYLSNYSSGIAVSPSRTIPIADLLNTPSNKIGVFGAVPNITSNGSRVFTTTSKYNLNPYNTLQFFVNKASDDTWGDEPDQDSTTYAWSTFGPYSNHCAIMQNYGIQPSNAGDYITTVLQTYVYFPTAGQYTFKFATDNNGYISLDGNVLLTTTADTFTNYTVGVSLTGQVGAGYHKIVISLTNVTGPMGVAAQILDFNNTDIWHTTPGTYGTASVIESVFLQYSKDNVYWNTIKEIKPFDITNPNQWYQQTVIIPADAKLQEVYLRLFQLQDNPDNNFSDNWAVSSLTATPVLVSALLNFNDPDSFVAGDATQVNFPSDITNGLSQYFNGSSQCFTAGYNSKYNLGANDFTIESWVRMSSAQTAGRVINSWCSSTTAAAQWEIGTANGNAIFFQCSADGITSAVSLNATGLTTNTWYHVVATRTGSVFNLYINGVLKATQTYADNYGTLNPAAGSGGTFSGGNLTWTSATVDQRIAISQLPINTKSYMEFTIGTKVAPQVYWQLGVYTNPTSWANRLHYRSDGLWQMQDATTPANSTSGTNWATFTTGDIIGIAYDPSTFTAAFFKNGTFVGSLTHSSRMGNVPVYFGCASDSTGGTATYTANFGQTSFQYVLTSNYGGYTGLHGLSLQSVADTLTIGARKNSSTSIIEYFNGYITNARVINGTSLYRSAVSVGQQAFTSPSTPLSAISNTVLLMCQNNTNVDNSTIAATLTNVGSIASGSGVVGNIMISPFAPQVVMTANPYMAPCSVEKKDRPDVKIGITGRNGSSNESRTRKFTTTNPISLRGYSGLRFTINKGGNGSGYWGDPPDYGQAETVGYTPPAELTGQYVSWYYSLGVVNGAYVNGEEMLLRYSFDGTNWVPFYSIATSALANYNQWYSFDVTMPDAIKDKTVYLQYYMNQAVTTSGSANDNWAVSPLFGIADAGSGIVYGTLGGPLTLGISDNPLILD